MADKNIPVQSGSRKCSVAGCDGKKSARGLCGKHYYRFRIHGDPLGGGTAWGSSLAWVAKHVTYAGDDCLPWGFARDASGYGKIWVCGKLSQAHRYMCIKAHGEPPTPVHQAAHSCGNGHLGCANPRHLSWKTVADNQADRLIHGTHNRGERCGTSKLTASDVFEIIDRVARGETQISIAKTYNVDQSSVSSIITGRKWSHLTNIGTI
jgi:hypothetical protein